MRRLCLVWVAPLFCALGCGTSAIGGDGGPPSAADGGGVLVDGGGPGGDGGTPNLSLAALSIDPAQARVAPGSRVSLTATGVYSDGSSADVTSLATWSIDSPQVAEVTLGVVRALTAGTARVTASFGGLSATATITVPNATFVSLAVTPDRATTGVGGTVQLHAVATLSDGSTQEVTSPTAAWSSAHPNIATVSASGLVTGVAAGTTTITATVGALSASATLEVSAAALASIAITPTNPVAARNVTIPFAAVGTYSDGSIADLTRTATWESSAPATVAITSGGFATTLSAGTSIISATVGNITGRTTVTVTEAALRSITISPATFSLAPRGTQSLTATGSYSDGTTLDITQSVAWSSSADAVAAVSNAEGSRGLVTAIGPGSATITAKLGDVSATAAATVVAATLTSITLSPAAPLVPLGTTLPLSARGTYSDGSMLDVTTLVAWSVDDPSIASVSNGAGSQGVVRGNALGTTTVRVSLGDVRASATLTVTAATLATITITPADTTIAVGLRQTMTAVGTFSDGTTTDVTRTAVWSTADPSIATVSNASGAQGQLTAVAPGTTTVSATQSGITGNTRITIAAATLTQIAVSPVAPTRAVGQTIQFAATAIFSNGTQQNVTLQATWASSNTAAVTINAQGQARAVAAGTTTISATVRGMTGSTPMTVSSATPVLLQVAPVAPSLAVGTALLFQATAVMSDDTSQQVTQQATWQSSAPSVLAFGGGGGGGPGGGGGLRSLATALSAGTATVTATWMGLSATTTVTVTAAVPVSISVFPAAVSAPVGAQRLFTAQVIYSDNTSRDVTQQATWQSSAPNIVGINDAAGGPGPGGGGGGMRGLATALAVGTATISASFSGLRGTATFTVTPATLSAVVIAPAAFSVPAGSYRQLTAQAIFSDNTSQDVTGQATWVSSAPSIAAVSDAAGGPLGGFRGLVTAIAAGTATIRATWSGVTGTATVTVTPATVTSIQISPVQPTVAVGTPILFNATAIYSDNTSQNVSPLTTWISSAPAVASIGTGGPLRGVAQALSPGTTTISATFGGVTGSTLLTVTPAELRTIQVTPFAPTIPVGFTTRLQATGIYSDNTTQDLTQLATWTSSAPSIASVSSSGLRGVLTPLSAGSATIQVSYLGVTGTDVVTVSGATLQSIAVQPATATIRRFASQPFTAVGTFSDASTLDVTVYVTWLSSTPSIADVSNAFGSQGVAKGLSVGTVTISAIRGATTGTATLVVTD